MKPVYQIELLNTVDHYLHCGRYSHAMQALLDAIHKISPTSSSEQIAGIETRIRKFHHKRRRDLLLALERRTAEPSSVHQPPPSHPAPTIDASRLKTVWIARYRDLLERHIFQWSTYYRQCVRDTYTEAAESADPSMLSDLRRVTAQHGSLVFRKGYDFKVSREGWPHDTAITIGLNGIQRFADVVLENYSEHAYAAEDSSAARRVRVVSSSMLTGIITGFGSHIFGGEPGWKILWRTPRAWLYILPYLSATDLETLVAHFDPGGEFRDGLELSVLPVVAAIDTALDRHNTWACLPRTVQYNWDSRRLEFILGFARGFSQQDLAVRCYMSRNRFNPVRDTDESLALAVDIMVAPVRPPEARHPGPTRVAVWENAKETAKTILTFLQDRFSARTAHAPLRVNPARRFPIEQAQVRDVFRVNRRSVQSLFGRCDTQTGVRLWCSIRRSGKTTACFNLEHESAATLVRQTMVETSAFAEDAILMRRIREGLSASAYLPRTFLMDVIRESARDRFTDSSRHILLLDEYEALFDLLSAEAAESPLKRTRFVLPLLEQFAAFSASNLILLVGQNPNAHYILMERNQLSASVAADQFPLFEHRPEGASEFRLLLQKVLSNQIRFDESFASAVYAETSGHPYLTVNILDDFCDWLVDNARSSSQLATSGVTKADFADFARKRLIRQYLLTARQYTFFRRLLTEGLSHTTRDRAPWVFGALSGIREIVRESPDTFALEQSRFVDIMAPLLGSMGMQPESLLAECQLSNFISITGDAVFPTIPLVARLAAVVRPRA